MPLAHHRAADPAFRRRAARCTRRRADRGERGHLGPRGRAHGGQRGDRAGRVRRGRLRLHRAGAAGRARHLRRPGADRDPRPPRPGDLHGALRGPAHVHPQGVHPAGPGDRPGDAAAPGGRPRHARPRPGPRGGRPARLAAGAHRGGGRGLRPLRRAPDVLPLHRGRDTGRAGPGGDRADGRARAHVAAGVRPVRHVGRRARPRPTLGIRHPRPPGVRHVGHHPVRGRCAAGTGPGTGRDPRGGAAAAVDVVAADRRRELHLAGGARRARLTARQQVRRGVPGRPAPRRLRARGHGRAARRGAGQGAVRRPARQCAGALGLLGRPRGVRGAAAPRRHRAGARTAVRRSSHPWLAGQLLRPLVRLRRVRRRRRDRADRPRPGAPPGAQPPAEGDRVRVDRLPAPPRLRLLPRGRRRGRRLYDRRRRAPDRPGRRRRGAEPGAVRGPGVRDHAQGAARPARRHDPVRRRAGRTGGPGGVPVHAGRGADAHHRREGRRVRRGGHPGVRRVRPPGGGERAGAGRSAGRRGLRRHHGRHGHPSDHRRSGAARRGRPYRPRPARRRGDRPGLLRAAARRRPGPAPGHGRGDHPGHGGGGDGADRSAGGRGGARPGGAGRGAGRGARADRRVSAVSRLTGAIAPVEGRREPGHGTGTAAGTARCATILATRKSPSVYARR
ncbi:hypothetical protein SGPA1_11761 [Streptomyces misionensis JCM 4497]